MIKSSVLRRSHLSALKKFSIFLFFYCFALSGFGQNKNGVPDFVIEGEIKNFGSGSLVGTIMDIKNNTFRTDTIIVKNGFFKHAGSINETQVVTYEPLDDKLSKYRKVVKNGDTVMLDFASKKAKSLEIVVAPGSRIRVTGTAKTYLDAYPSGTRENDQLSGLNKKIYPFLDSLGDLDYTNKSTISKVLKTEERLLASVSKLEDDFVKRNPSSIIASYIVWGKYKILNKKNPTKADRLLTQINPAKHDIYRSQIALMQKGRAQGVKKVLVGDMFPVFFSTIMYNGSGYNLTETRGKYTLIDFWGTWCIPCVREMPRLKEYYEKFRDRINFVGIANDKYLSWKSFLDKHKYDWIQLLDQDNPKLSETLDVKVYPTKYLLDSSGRVIEIFKDSDETVWRKLDSLMKS